MHSGSMLAKSSSDGTYSQEQERLVEIGRGPALRTPTIHGAFQNRARQFPADIAIDSDVERVTYQELDARSDSVASALKFRHWEAVSKAPVALIVNRSAEMVVGMLALAKAGATYVPLSNTFPTKMLEDAIDIAESKFVLTTRAAKDSVPTSYQGTVLIIEDLQRDGKNAAPFDAITDSSASLMLVFTSGSTGKPKGIVVRHSGIARLFDDSVFEHIKRGVRLSNVVAISFDGGQSEILIGLARGATMVMRANTYEVFATIDVLHTTPTGLSQIRPEEYPQIHTVYVGSEPLPPSTLKMWSSRRVIELYGPSETSFVVCGGQVSTTGTITVGYPLTESQLVILDEDMRLSPLGEVGLLYVGGLAVTPGYWKAPEETARKFREVLPGQGIMYATGDLARWTENGTLQILGRQDNQVKYKGYRVELEEVALAICSVEGVSNAAVIIKDGLLTGFYSSFSGEALPLREALRNLLAEYMIPALLIRLDNITANSNGKIDFKALTDMDIPQAARHEIFSDDEQLMATIWSETLNISARAIGKAQSFFELGGDSLSAIKLSIVSGKYGMPVAVTDVYKVPILKDLALLASSKTLAAGMEEPKAPCTESVEIKALVHNTLTGVDIQDIFPTTNLQAALYMLHERRSSKYVSNTCFGLDPTLEISPASIRAAWERLVAARDILRTTFCKTTQGIFQVVSPAAQPNIHEHSLSVGAELDRFLEEDCRAGFDADELYLHRLAIIRHPGDGLSVVITMHHALYDGWTLEILFTELFSALRGEALCERPSFRKFVDYTAQLPKEPAEQYWRAKLENAKQVERLHYAAKTLQVAPSAILQVAWALVLRQSQRVDDVIFGNVNSNRHLPIADVDKICGILLTTSPKRIQLLDDPTLFGLCRKVHDEASEELEHFLPNFNEPGDKIWLRSLHGDECEYELTLTLRLGTTIACEFAHDSGVMDVAHVKHIASAWESVLREVVGCIASGQDLCISSIDAWQKEEEQRILRFSRGTQRALPEELLHNAFERHAEAHPDDIAAECDHDSLTYGEMEQRANQLANKLHRLGVGPGSNVAIITKHSINNVVACLAVLKAGCAYVPADANHPLQRIAAQLERVAIAAILTEEYHSAVVPGLECPVILISEELSMPGDVSRLRIDGITSSDNACALFTSGTTGIPKCVFLKHRGLQNIVGCTIFATGIKRGAKVGQVMSVTFDACAGEIWPALSYGATLIIRGRDIRSVIRKVDVLVITPTVLSGMRQKDYTNLKMVITGGETMKAAIVQEWADKVQLVNIYGPTEHTIFTHAAIMKSDLPVSLGIPIVNTEVFLLDSKLRPVPIGVSGEIYLAGVGLSDGYYGNPEKTKEAFIELNGIPMHKTGDLGRWNDDGTLHIIGRADRRVKLGGYRIELDEVAHVLQHTSGVSDATVAVYDKTIVGFVTPSTVDVEAVREEVSKVLPYYAVPTVIYAFDAFPLSSNKKADVKQLIELVQSAPAAVETYLQEEQRMRELWAHLLGVDIATITKNTSWFQLGGDSISAVRASIAARQAGFMVETNDFFVSPTLRRLVAACMARSQRDIGNEVAQATSTKRSLLSEEERQTIFTQFAQPWGVEMSDVLDIYPTTSIQEGMLMKTIQDPRAFYGFSTWSVDGGHLTPAHVSYAWKTLCNHHAILRTRFAATARKVYHVELRDATSSDVTFFNVEISDEEILNRLISNCSIESGKMYALAACVGEGGNVERIVKVIHHALYDGWSMQILEDDFATAVNNGTLPPSNTFQDFLMATSTLDQDRTVSFWKEELSGMHPSEPFEVSSPSSPEAGFPVFQTALAAVSPQSLSRFCCDMEVTISSLFKAAWALVLRHYLRTDDVVFGVTHSGRDMSSVDTGRMVGPLLNTVPQRVTLHDDMSVSDILYRLHNSRSAFSEFGHLGMIEIKQAAGLSAKQALFHTLLIVQNFSGVTPEKERAIRLTNEKSGGTFNEFAMSMAIQLHTTVNIETSYDGRLYNEADASAILETFEQFLVAMISSAPTVLLQLDQQADALAATLKQEGTLSGDRIALLVASSTEAILARLAVLKAGAAYIVLDGHLPLVRLNTLLDTIKAPIVLYMEQFRQKAQGIRRRKVLCISSPQTSFENTEPIPMSPARSSSEAAAFLLLADGTATNGKPKVVEVTHQAAMNVLQRNIWGVPIEPGMRVSANLKTGTRMAEWELWTSLIAGASSILSKEQQPTSSVGEAVDVLWATGSTLDCWHPETRHRGNIKLLINVEDPMKPETNLKLQPIVGTMRFAFASAEYGLAMASAIPTPIPTTDPTTDPAAATKPYRLIGRAIPNMAFQILDPDMRRVPVGRTGTIYVHGVGVSANGYLGHQSSTKETFVSLRDERDGEGKGRWAFKTAYKGRFTRDGRVELVF
ncbi:uncharacterized protein EV422DRAFT_563406 [Fimicolochytrium jonesii]|uniref:uncharacterized protein n=1 Tax=Fimicolochytrium jonesii TaxID=1396493 RepID=UPI0022FDD8DF|nr:uncharacterized protein EV422DRAFT_563406 [Fimicolochytrium jonesii]KAI8825575.1 hypothetical protein EV422DRAFT_563406 [Fimicolochytrium jonesii]